MTKINKNVAIVVIAVLSLIISVWVMSSINAAFGTSVTTAYVFIAWMMRDSLDMIKLSVCSKI